MSVVGTSKVVEEEEEGVRGFRGECVRCWRRCGGREGMVRGEGCGLWRC